MRIFVVCLGLFFGCSFPAFSFPAVFDFTASPSDYHFINGSLILDVDAGTYDVTDTSKGLGVDSGGSDNGPLDGIGTKESLWFAFSETVRLLDVSFYWVGDNDAFTLSLGDADLFDPPIKIPQIGTRGGFFDFSSYDFASDFFSIKAGDSSSFRVKAMTVDSIPVPTPEPATWLLLAVGVSGLLLVRRQN